jgi:AbrB family looped-hinge helix DNA binding protein
MDTTLDKFGRIVIPKKIRDDFNLKPGPHIRIEENDNMIILKPVYGEPSLIDKGGILVFTGSAAGNIEDALSRHRGERLGGCRTKQ